MLSSRLNPDFARLVLGDQYVDMTLENIQKGDPMAVYKDSGPFGMSIGIAANNLFVALRTAIFGVLASIGTAFILLYNGIMVGAFQYFFCGTRRVLGIVPDDLDTRHLGNQRHHHCGCRLVGGRVRAAFSRHLHACASFSIVDAKGAEDFHRCCPDHRFGRFFEGFLTRFTGTPAPIRAAFIAVSLIFVLWYFVWLPWHKARHTGFKHVARALELLPDRGKAPRFYGDKIRRRNHFGLLFAF